MPLHRAPHRAQALLFERVGVPLPLHRPPLSPCGLCGGVFLLCDLAASVSPPPGVLWLLLRRPSPHVCGRGVCVCGCPGCPLAQQCGTPLWVMVHTGHVGWPCRSQNHNFCGRGQACVLRVAPLACGVKFSRVCISPVCVCQLPIAPQRGDSLKCSSCLWQFLRRLLQHILHRIEPVRGSQ